MRCLNHVEDAVLVLSCLRFVAVESHSNRGSLLPFLDVVVLANNLVERTCPFLTEFFLSR